MPSPNLPETHNYPCREGGGDRVSCQVLIPSPNLPKTQIPYVNRWGGGDHIVSSKLLMPSPNLSKTQIPYVQWEWGMESFKGWCGECTRLLMFSPNLPKTQIPYFWKGEGEGYDCVRYLVRF